MTYMKRLSPYSDAFCKACGEPAAEGLADSKGLWCKTHGEARAAFATEEAIFALLQTYGRDALAAVIAGVERYDGTPEHLYSYSFNKVVT